MQAGLGTEDPYTTQPAGSQKDEHEQNMSGPRLSRTAHVSPRKPIASAVAFGQSRQVMARGEGKSKGGPFIEISCKAWSSEKILELAGLSGCAGLRQRLTAPPREAKKARAAGGRRRQRQSRNVLQCLAICKATHTSWGRGTRRLERLKVPSHVASQANIGNS